MRRSGIAAFLAVILLVGTVGIVAYNLGISAGTTEAAVAAGASVIYAPATLSPFGLIIGAFFLIVLIGFLTRSFGRPRGPLGWPGWGRYGSWGNHPGHGGGPEHHTMPEPFGPMFERWHREAHAAAGRDSTAARSTPSGARSQPPGPASSGATPPPGSRPA